MSIVIACPECAAKMKIAKMPATASKIKCPHCKHAFAIGPSVKAGPPPAKAGSPVKAGSPPAKREPVEERTRPRDHKREKAGMSLGILLAIGGGVLAVGGIAVGAVLMFGGGSPENKKDETPQAKNKPLNTGDEAERERLEKERQIKLAQDKVDKEQADKERAEKEKAAQDKLAQEKIAEENDKAYRDFLRKGDKAAGAKKWSDAIAAYEGALKLKPNDTEATELLTAARAELAQTQNQDDVQKKRQEALAKRLLEADNALAKKKWGDARGLYKLVWELDPGNELALAGLKKANDELEKDTKLKTKFEKIDEHIAAGKDALKAGKYAEAIREFKRAQDLDPFNPLPAQLTLDAQAAQEKLLAANKDKKDPKDPKDDDKRKAEYTNLVSQADVASKKNDYQEAQRLYQLALMLYPNDPFALARIAVVQNAMRQAQIQYDQQMQLAQQAYQAAKYYEALAIYQEMFRRDMRNKELLKILRDAEQKSYEIAILKGNDFMTRKLYRDAEKEFDTALTVRPDDAIALDGKQCARAGFANTDVEAKNLKDFERLVLAGNRDLKNRKYSLAAKEFADAAKLMPNNDQSPGLIKQSRYALAMDKGWTAWTANPRRVADSIKSFKTALEEFPADKAATDALAQAQNVERAAQDFTRFTNEGVKSIQAQRWLDASQSFQAALKADFNNKDAAKVASYGRYADAMNRGQLALTARSREEAIAAYQAALAEIRGDPTALMKLQNAMLLPKKK